MSVTKSISLPERFDFSFNKSFTEQYQSILAEPENVGKIVLDFSRVVYLDSSALGMMVLLHRKAKALKISAAVKGMRSSAAEILKMANFQKLYLFE